MSDIPSYTSIYNLGHKAITDLLKSEVIVEEKIDGSQFSFMKGADGVLRFRSKGKEIFAEAPEQLFADGVRAVIEIDKAYGIPPGHIFRGEYLSKPKHNVLPYDRIPQNHIIIFDIDDGNEGYLSPEDKGPLAASLGLEVVPVLFEGMLDDPATLRELLDKDSVLGKVKLEGIVIKPAKYDLFGRDKKVLMGKFVSEAFKEVHKREWKATNQGPQDIIALLSAAYSTPQRWQKAIQHLRDDGKLEDSPRDIGPLMKEIPNDVLKECEEELKEKVWEWAWPQLRRTLTRGFPEYYKQKLLDKQFEAGDPSVALIQDFPVPVLAEPQIASASVTTHGETIRGEARESNNRSNTGRTPILVGKPGHTEQSVSQGSRGGENNLSGGEGSAVAGAGQLDEPKKPSPVPPPAQSFMQDQTKQFDPADVPASDGV